MPFFAGWQPLWVGFLCALLPQQQQPHHCLLWLGQDCKGTSVLFHKQLWVFSCLPDDLKIMACITWHFSDAFFADEGRSWKAQLYNNCELHWFCWGLAFLRRCGTWPTASWRPTTLVTVATWTQWLCLLMAPCVHLVEGYEIDLVLNDSGDSFWACRFHQWWIWNICIRLMKNQRLFLRDACIF